jgi:hypothetical protein
MYLYYSNCNSKCTKQKANVIKQLYQFLHTTDLENLCSYSEVLAQSVRIYTATVWWF